MRIGNIGLLALANGIGSVGDSVAGAMDRFYQRKSLSDLGELYKSGDYGGAFTKAMQMGAPELGIKMLGLGQTREADREAVAALGGPAPAAASPSPTAAGAFQPIVQRTLGFEGGYNPRDNNGAPVNFGINQAANPDVDVKNLDQQKAVELYKQRYWEPIGGDALAQQNPQLAKIAFDTAVMAGPARAKQFIKASGGDPAKFMDIREKFLSDLAARDPNKYGGDVKASWDKRNAALRGDIGGGAGIAPTPASATGQTPQGGGDFAAERQQLLQQIEQLSNIGARPYISEGLRSGLTAKIGSLKLRLEELDKQSVFPKDRPAMVQEYEYAKANGFKGTPEQWKQLNRQQVNIDQRQESEFNKGMGVSDAKAFDQMRASGNEAPANMSKLELLNKLINSVNTGALAPAKSQIVRYAKAFGISDDAIKSVAGLDPNLPQNQQAMQKVINEMTMGMIGPGGFPANNFSDADRNFLAQIFPNIANEPGANKIAIEVLKRVEQRKMEKLQAWEQYRTAAKDNGRTPDFQEFESAFNRNVQGTNMFEDIAKQVQSNLPKEGETPAPPRPKLKWSIE